MDLLCLGVRGGDFDPIEYRIRVLKTFFSLLNNLSVALVFFVRLQTELSYRPMRRRQRRKMRTRVMIMMLLKTTPPARKPLYLLPKSHAYHRIRACVTTLRRQWMRLREAFLKLLTMLTVLIAIDAFQILSRQIWCCGCMPIATLAPIGPTLYPHLSGPWSQFGWTNWRLVLPNDCLFSSSVLMKSSAHFLYSNFI